MKNKRKFPPAKQMTSFRLPPDLVSDLKVAAEKQRVSVTDFVINALKDRLESATAE